VERDSVFLGVPRSVFVGAVLTAVLGTAPSARACAVCATADVTLSPVDGEAPFRGRLQATLDAREGWVEEAGVTVSDHRADFGLHYAPNATFLLSLGVPVLLRRVSGPGDPETVRTLPGDVELRVDRAETTWLKGGVRQRFGVFAELKLPTANLERDGVGQPLSSVLQPGCGSFVPAAGVDYYAGRRHLALFASLSVWLPFAVRSGYHAGDSIRGGARVQWQPLPSIALRAGGNLDAEASGELAHGTSDPNSGGLLGYVAAEIVTRPFPDFVFEVGALYPALALLSGDHHEGPIATVTLGYDF
jgi:hypothetical protein